MPGQLSIGLELTLTLRIYVANALPVANFKISRINLQSVLVDAYSKYPCIHPTTSTSSKSTTAILEQEFAHFGYPHTLVTDNATTFMSQEFQAWCKQRGIVHLTGAPYHPATNGAAERLIQSFKQALRKSSLPPKEALQEFLMQYKRIPFASGLSPSELFQEEFAPKLTLWFHPFRISCREDSQNKRASIQMLKTRKWFRKSNIITH